MNVTETFEALLTTLRYAGFRVQVAGEKLEPPCVVLVPPSFEWNAPSIEPSDASFGVACSVQRGDRTAAELIDMVQKVVKALDTSSFDMVVKSAEPGIGPENLPSYIIEVEAGLTDAG